jgi:hypothetical protein
MKAYGGVEVYLHPFLALAQIEVSGKLHAPSALSPVPIEWKAEWATELVWTFLEEGKVSCPCWDSNPVYHPYNSKVKCSGACHESIWGSKGIAPLILRLGTRWMWGVSITPWPLYSQGKHHLAHIE